VSRRPGPEGAGGQHRQAAAFSCCARRCGLELCSMHDSLFPRPASGIAMTFRAPRPRLVLPPAVCEDV
jgi:hypothetical protein